MYRIYREYCNSEPFSRCCGMPGKWLKLGFVRPCIIYNHWTFTLLTTKIQYSMLNRWTLTLLLHCALKFLKLLKKCSKTSALYLIRAHLKEIWAEVQLFKDAYVVYVLIFFLKKFNYVVGTHLNCWGNSNEYLQHMLLKRSLQNCFKHWLCAVCTVIRSNTRWLSWMRRPTGDQEVAGSTPAEVSNILSWRLIMKYFLRSFSPFCWFKKGSCQFLAKECAQYWLTP